MAARHVIFALLAGASSIAAAPSDLVRRQCTNPGTGSPLPVGPKWRTTLIGDGNPHQSYVYSQLTDNTDCNGNVGCEIAQTEVEGTSFSWSAGISGGGWISGGFEVAQYVESGQVANCQGEKGDVICVFWRAAHTDYTVEQYDECGYADPILYETVIYSPNTGAQNKGSSFLCGRGAQCKNRGYEFTIRTGIVGGPQVFPYEDDNNLGPV